MRSQTEVDANTIIGDIEGRIAHRASCPTPSAKRAAQPVVLVFSSLRESAEAGFARCANCLGD